MSERVNPISLRSKRLIVESLMSIMEEKPFSKIAIRDIVEKAGLTRQTFYHNFKSKEEALMYKLDELFDGFFKIVVDNNVITCEDIIYLYFRYWQTNENFLKLLIKNNLVYILNLKYPEYFKIVQLIYLKDKGISDVEGEYVFAFITGAVIDLLVTWMNDGQVTTPREMSKFVMKILEGTFYDLHVSKAEKQSRIDYSEAQKNMEI